jgi:hypothetical protein
MSYIGCFPGDAKRKIYLLWNYIHSRFYNILNEFHTIGTGIRRPNNNDSSHLNEGDIVPIFISPGRPLKNAKHRILFFLNETPEAIPGIPNLILFMVGKA